MTSIADIRAKFPQYEDFSDADLVKGVHAKFYSDIPFDDFSGRIDGLGGVSGETQAAPQEQAQAVSQPIEEQQQAPLASNAGTGLIGAAAANAARLFSRGAPSKSAAAQRGIAQGATFGFGDEIAGGAASLASGEPFKDSVEFARGLDDAAKEAHPAVFTGGEVAGALATGGLASGGRNLGIKGAAAGGAVLGAGNAEGGAVERAQGAAIGGTVGAVGGKVGEKLFPVIASGVRSAGARLAGKTGLAKSDKVLLKEVMRQNKLGRDEAIDLIKNADGDTPELLFQTLGLQEFAEGVATKGGTSRKALEDAIITQQRGQQDRILQATQNIIGGDNFNALKGEIGEKLSQEGSKLYQEAFEQPFTVSRKLAQLSQRPSMQKALKQGARIAADEGIEIKDNPLLTYHYAKLGVDKMIGTSVRKSGGNPHARALLGIKNDLLAEMDIVPQYGAARKLWAGQKANEAALELGRGVLSKRADDIAVAAKDLSEGERQHLLAGVIQAVDDKLQTKALSHDAGTAFKSEKVRNVLRELLTEEQSTKMLSMIDAESRLTQTGRRVRPSFGSPTAPKQEAARRVGIASAGAGRRAVANSAGAVKALAQPVESIKTALNVIAGKVGKEDPTVIEALAVRLSGTPEEAAAVFSRLSDEAQSRTSIAWAEAGGLAPYITGVATATKAPRIENRQSQPAE